MAIYHLSLKPISRSAGRSSTAAAAYRSASRIVDERTGEVWDFTKKRGVEHAEIVLPAGSTWEVSRADLWNAAEAAERRKDACVAREHEVALPRELNNAQRLALVREYAADLANRLGGAAVDFAIHAPRDDAPHGAENWHAHLLCSTRKVDGAGFADKLGREKAGRNRKADLQYERQRWEEICNKYLAAAGIAEQIDHRSLVDQGIVDRQPTTHDGPAVAAMKRSQRNSRRDDEEQQRQAAKEAARNEQQKAEAEHDARRAERLRQRIRREPNRLHGESAGNRYARLDGLTKETRQGGREIWRFKPQAGAELGAVAIIDHGDSISIVKNTDSRIGAAVALAKEKGWTSLVLTGDKPFLYAAARAAHAAGLRIENTEPELQAFVKSLENQPQAPRQKPQPPAAPTAKVKAPATPPATPSDDMAGLTPGELGECLRQVETKFDRQEAALKHADSMGYASVRNREKHLKTQLDQARAKVFEDGPTLRMAFAANISTKYIEERETAEKARRQASLEIQQIEKKHTLGRLLAAGQRRDAAARLVDAERREKAAARRIEQIEAASQAMKEPKTREAYRRWAMSRMKQHNVDVDKLEKLVGQAGAERSSIERKSGFDPDEHRSLAEEKKNLLELGNALAFDSRKQFEVGRDPEAERRRKADEADTQARLKKLERSAARNAPRAPSRSGPGM